MSRFRWVVARALTTLAADNSPPRPRAAACTSTRPTRAIRIARSRSGRRDRRRTAPATSPASTSPGRSSPPRCSPPSLPRGSRCRTDDSTPSPKTVAARRRRSTGNRSVRTPPTSSPSRRASSTRCGRRLAMFRCSTTGRPALRRHRTPQRILGGRGRSRQKVAWSLPH